MQAPSSRPNADLLCTFWEITLLRIPISSFEEEGRNPCYGLRRLSCDARASSVCEKALHLCNDFKMAA